MHDYYNWKNKCMHSSIYIFSTIWPKEAKRGKNGPKLQKTLSVVPFISETIYISYGLHLWYTCMYKRTISPGFFFISSKFWLSGSLGWAKGQKVAQNDKIFCLSHSASQEPYIIWLWFLVHMCKIFFIFSEVWFLRFLGG